MSEISIEEILTNSGKFLANLTLISKAHNVRYALGKTPDQVGGESMEEHRSMIQLAREVVAGDRSTENHRKLASHMSTALWAAERAL